MRRRPLSCFCLLLILLIFLGTVTGMTGRTDKEWDEEGCTLTGRVYDKEWVTGEEEKKIVYLEILEADNASGMEDAEGKKVLCYLKQGQELPKLGSYIRITGKIRNFRKASNPGQFDARSYYRISGIAFQINQVIIQQKSEQYQKGKEALFQLRKGLSETFDRQLSPENASLMKTMVLGEKKALDREIKKRYQRNGIAHLLAISGLHISLIGMAFYKVLRKTALPVSFCAGGAFLFMYGYGCMAGFSVSSRRALIMFGVQMAAVMFGRTYDLLTSVSLAALLILAEQPWDFYSSSFLFSFGCVLAIGLLVPAMTCKKTEALSRSDGKKKAAAVVRQDGIFWKLLEGLRKWLLPGCAISAAGLPLQLCFYYQMPVYATFLNLLVIPLMSFLLPCGLLLILVERAEILAIPFSFVITGILGIYESACLMVENLPFSVQVTGRPGTVLIILYLIVLLFLILYQRKLSLKGKWLILLSAGALLVFSGRMERTVSRQLQVTFLDVGQGDCICVEGPEHKTYLIDGGSSDIKNVGKYRIEPFLKYRGIGSIDYVFVSHGDIDHMNGIEEMLKRQQVGIKIRNLVVTGEAYRDEKLEELISVAEDNGTTVWEMENGTQIREGKLRFTCLGPKEKNMNPGNEASMILHLEYEGFDMLFTGDVEKEGEESLTDTLSYLQEKKISWEVLKTAHHGSKNSTTEAFLENVKPRYAWISAGRKNRYGHPHKDTLERLENSGAKIYSTQENGAFGITVNKKSMRIHGRNG